MLLVSAAGGEEVEAKAAVDPSVIARFPLELLPPLAGSTPPDAVITAGSQGHPTGDFLGAAHAIGLSGTIAEKAADLFTKMTRVAIELDATLVEINPLAITTDGRLITLDAKVTVDANALFRHPALSALGAQIQIDDGDPKELAADRHQINYQRMDGNIGTVCNGAGLALATLDMLIDSGGTPANFMDIRTTASSLDIAYGLGVILDNPQVRVILINIHGGGMQRCDTVAEGVAVALRRADGGGTAKPSNVKRQPPLVVRFAGNNADFARVRLKGAGVAFEEAHDLEDAISRTVAIAKRCS